MVIDMQQADALRKTVLFGHLCQHCSLKTLLRHQSDKHRKMDRHKRILK